jgi:TolA-binding protein
MPNQRPGMSCSRILVPIALLAFTGCAYYNTFYLAKRYYKDAQREQDRTVSEGISVGAATKYEQVVRQCTKVLSEYPKSKYVDDATYLMGASLYGKGDYAGAIRRLDELEAKFPKSPYVPEARLVKGLAHYRQKDYEEADSIFQSLDQAYPKLSRRWELYFYEGENRLAQKDYPTATVWYRRAIRAADGRRQRSDALRRAGDALFQGARMDSAQLVYDEALKSEERPKQRVDIVLQRSEALRDLKRYPEALDLLQKWRPTALAEEREGEVLLRIYELEALLGKPNDAIKGYQQIIERYPGTSMAFEAQFQIGYLYESALGDLDQAAREYDKLRNAAGGSNTFAAQALRRSQSLATLREYRQSLAADTTGGRARTAFRLAEVYYFELAKTDSALAQYRAVEALYPKSVYAPKSAYARLWIAAYDRGDTLGAMQLTDSVAARYRGTRYAESALYLWKQWSGRSDERTALFESLLAHPDTSAAARFAEDTEPVPSGPPTSVVPPTTSAPDSGYQVPPALMEQLRARADEARRQKRASHGGQPQQPQQQQPPQPPPAPADTTRAAGRAPADTTRGASAPADTTRGASAPADTTRPKTGGSTP